MSRYVGYLFVCILWLFVPMGAWAVSKDKNPILIICSYNPAAHQTSVTISDYMEEYGKLGGQRDIIIENMNCKSFSEAPLWSDMMTQILSKYQGEKHPGQIILRGAVFVSNIILNKFAKCANLKIKYYLCSINKQL